jgi:hypothetical protein
LHAYEIRHPGEPDGPNVPQIEATLLRIKALPGVQFTSIGRLAAEHPELVTPSHIRAAVPTRWAFDSRALWHLTRQLIDGRVEEVYWPEAIYRQLWPLLLIPATVGLLFAVGVALLLSGLLRTRSASRLARLFLGLLALVGAAAALQWTRWLFTFRVYPFGPARQFLAAAAVTGCLLLAVLLLASLRRPRPAK